jgi:uncharacterized DUF497 family protein
MSATLYDFDWDTNKARTNLVKHGVSFRLASSVFRDPLALTIFDHGHSTHEDRWVTVGRAANGQTLVVIHSSQWMAPAVMKLRIISARRADRDEIRDYENTPR